MGFYSPECKRCGHPLLSPAASHTVNRWMELVVVIRPDGSLREGVYDGYGQVVDDQTVDGTTTLTPTGNAVTESVWHQDCWLFLDRPAGYAGPSTLSDDQGYFFDNEHDVKSPVVERLEAINQASAEVMSTPELANELRRTANDSRLPPAITGLLKAAAQRLTES